MGVWIEINLNIVINTGGYVAPFVGVWIEIYAYTEEMARKEVAPFVGVWIEIINCGTFGLNWNWSLPLWECGLKYENILIYHIISTVAPFVGVWIEILCSIKLWHCI